MSAVTDYVVHVNIALSIYFIIPCLEVRKDVKHFQNKLLREVFEPKAGNSQSPLRNMSHCHFVQYKVYMNWPRTEPVPMLSKDDLNHGDNIKIVKSGNYELLARC